MNPIAAILDTAERLGVDLFISPSGKLGWRCNGPLPDRLKAELVANKAAVLAALQADAGRPTGPVFWLRVKTGHGVYPRSTPPPEWTDDVDGLMWCREGDPVWIHYRPSEN
jgi:hypothetical protein